MISPRTVEKPLNILKKRVVFSIWRAEKWKFIAGDWIKRFSLIVRNFSQDFYQKRFIKILKNSKNIFIFLDWKFEIFWKISTFFIFEGKIESHFRRIENEKSRDFFEIFQKFQIFHPEKWKCFSKIYKIFKNRFLYYFCKSCARSARIFLRDEFLLLCPPCRKTTLFFRIFKGFSTVRGEIICLEEMGAKSNILETCHLLFFYQSFSLLSIVVWAIFF